MADFEGLDDATLQQMISDATSYEERSALRQALRKRKKDRGGAAASNKPPRGRSTYNRFAGSTVTKTKAASKSSITPEPPKGAPKQETKSSYTQRVKQDSSTEQLPTTTPTPEPAPETPPSLVESPTEDSPESVCESPCPAPVPAREEETLLAAQKQPCQDEETTAPEEVESTPVTEELAQDEAPPSPCDEKPAQDEAPPSPCDEKPAQDEAAPSPCDEKPAQDEAPPSPCDEKPAQDEAPPSPCDEKPAQDEAPPCDEKPAQGEAPPSPCDERQGKHPPPCSERPSKDKRPPAPSAKVEERKKREVPQQSDSKIKEQDTGSSAGQEWRQVPDTVAAGAVRGRSFTDGAASAAKCGSSSDQLHQYLVAYVNKELTLRPALPAKGKALFDTCSDPANLCKLINKSVPGTIDLRALSKVQGSATQRSEAIEDNMTLAVESARAIGCYITDSTSEKIIRSEPETITNFMVDLIKARVVHLPGMEDEPSSSFKDWTYLFEKLHITLDSNQVENGLSWRDEDNRPGKPKAPPTSSKKEDSSWKGTGQSNDAELTYEQRAAKRKADREKRLKEKEAEAGSVGLTFEERAMHRKAERERRKREREALAK